MTTTATTTSTTTTTCDANAIHTKWSTGVARIAWKPFFFFKFFTEFLMTFLYWLLCVTGFTGFSFCRVGCRFHPSSRSFFFCSISLQRMRNANERRQKSVTDGFVNELSYKDLFFYFFFSAASLCLTQLSCRRRRMGGRLKNKNKRKTKEKRIPKCWWAPRVGVAPSVDRISIDRR